MNDEDVWSKLRSIKTSRIERSNIKEIFFVSPTESYCKLPERFTQHNLAT